MTGARPNPKPEFTVRKSGDNYILCFRGSPVEHGLFATRKTADKHKAIAEYEWARRLAGR